jgi:hypothetical protein
MVLQHNQIPPFIHEIFLCWRSYYQVILDSQNAAARQTNVENKLLSFFAIANFNDIIQHAALRPAFVYVATHHSTDVGVGPGLRTFLGLPQNPPKICNHPFWDFIAGIRHIICLAYQGLGYQELQALQAQLHNLLQPVSARLAKPEQWILFDLIGILSSEAL